MKKFIMNILKMQLSVIEKKYPLFIKELKAAGVKYVLSSWIDLHGIPKSKPVPMTDFEPLCLGKGPQFAVHSISFVPELTPADSDQVMLPDLDSVLFAHGIKLLQ